MEGRGFEESSAKWNIIVRSPKSALRVFTSSERLANQMKINEMDAPRVGTLVKKSELSDSKVEKAGKVGTLVQKVEMGDTKTGK